MNIREAELNDAQQIADIYNYYIEHTHHTFETKAVSAEVASKRIREVTEDYPFLVAEKDSVIYGYCYADQFKLREAYEFSAEVSIYVRSGSQQRGVGTLLYEDLFEELEDTDVHAIIAGIALPNAGSIKFHEKLGFEKVAHFREVGYKLGRWIDVGYWELMNRI